MAVSAAVDGIDPGSLTFQWQASKGSISGSGNEIRYTAPNQKCTAELQVKVTDQQNSVSTQSISLIIYKQIGFFKADDVKYDPLHVISPAWQKFFDYMKSKQIKASAGLICNSLEFGDQEYYFRLKELHQSPYFELFNHGYDHSAGTNEKGEKYVEFQNTPYEYQKEHLLKAQSLTKEKLNITLRTFGAPENAIDDNTTKAMEEVDDLKIWFFGKPEYSKMLLSIWGTVESPTCNPNYEEFIKHYFPTVDYYVLQIHPWIWTDEQFGIFEKILDYLIQQEVTFLLPYEYYQLTNMTECSEIDLSRTRLNFGAEKGGKSSIPQEITIQNNGMGIMNWNASTTAPWIKATPASGTGTGILKVSVDHAGLNSGTYTGEVIISDADAINSPQSINILLKVYNKNATKPPFGDFSTPLDNATVCGSIAVTGWVLDDIGVKNVSIETRGMTIGEAVFVEGARPDIEQAYRDYPLNYRAGWGYMLLTNCLPGGGNGKYILKVVAVDEEGKKTTLGTKTIVVDNKNATKPFGAIDTPPQGGTASGSTYNNVGWVLTPMPNKIPENGSTIEVFVDGVKLGHPGYNIPRQDIAALFPGYANSNGAAAIFTLDTTSFSNGVHTIYWIATDNAGNSEGIGSRYFTVQN